MNQSINQRINQSIHQCIKQSINTLINQSINPSINPSINQSIKQSINQASKPAINQFWCYREGCARPVVAEGVVDPPRCTPSVCSLAGVSGYSCKLSLSTASTVQLQCRTLSDKQVTESHLLKRLHTPANLPSVVFPRWNLTCMGPSGVLPKPQRGCSGCRRRPFGNPPGPSKSHLWRSWDSLKALLGSLASLLGLIWGFWGATLVRFSRFLKVRDHSLKKTSKKYPK